MKTALKVGQKVNIFKLWSAITFPNDDLTNRPPLCEGVATLVKLVRKCYSAVRPFETWIVKFDDDEEPVERDIAVRLPQPSSMASSLARSPESKKLLAFMDITGLSDDWVDPVGHGVVAHVNGRVLNNAVGAVELSGDNQINDEILVHLEHSEYKVVLNLNTLLVFATRYIKQQFDIATEAVQGKETTAD
jgi:hypothetical protein